MVDDAPRAPGEAMAARAPARLSSGPDDLARLVRALDASVNVALLRELCRRRRRGEGWAYLSELAQALREAPGTVGAALDKLGRVGEERREKGRRYARAAVADVVMTAELPSTGVRGPRRARGRP